MQKFEKHLEKHGLKVHEVDSDGNCLFGAISDQLYGSEDKKDELRQQTCKYMQENKEEYRLFLEDDMDFDKYCVNMKRDGIWGGQMELTIMAQLHRFNVIVHQVENPSMAQGFFPWGEVPCLHISFHLECHYNSVRREDDPCDGKPATDYEIGHDLSKRRPDAPIQEEKKEQII